MDKTSQGHHGTKIRTANQGMGARVDAEEGSESRSIVR